MKYNYVFIRTGLILTWSFLVISALAQQNWKTVGNPDTGPDGLGGGNNLIGSTQNTDVHIITGNSVAGTFDGAGTNLGFFGLNTITITNAPFARFHQHLGDFLIVGPASLPITSSVPITGAGHRVMWVESKAAFRVGGIGINGIFADGWDLANIGKYVVVGKNWTS